MGEWDDKVGGGGGVIRWLSVPWVKVGGRVAVAPPVLYSLAPHRSSELGGGGCRRGMRGGGGIAERNGRYEVKGRWESRWSLRGEGVGNSVGSLKLVFAS